MLLYFVTYRVLLEMYLVQCRVRNRVDSGTAFITYHTTMHGVCESSAVLPFATTVFSFLQRTRRAANYHYNLETSVRSILVADIDYDRPYGVQPFSLVLQGNHSTFGLSLAAGVWPYLAEPDKLMDIRFFLKTQYVTSQGKKYSFPYKGIVTLGELSLLMMPLNVSQGVSVYAYLLNYLFDLSGLRNYNVVLPFSLKGKLELLPVTSFTITDKINPFGFSHRSKWKPL